MVDRRTFDGYWQNMSRSTTHALQTGTDHDGGSRRLAVLACKSAIRGSLEKRVKDSFEKKPASVKSSAAYRLWSGLNRASQDRMWRVLAEQIDNDEARTSRVAEDAVTNAKGRLSLAENDCAPGYLLGKTIHGQPGGYLLERHPADLAAGAFYEAGGNIYALGQGIGARDSKAQRLIAYIREVSPQLQPRRILEMGCSAGAQSADYPAEFPRAECHAIDVSAAMLRYAHVRTELLSEKVAFWQCDAAETAFPSGHFDLIVSHNLFHEVAAEHTPKIAQECFRLLADGGLCVHQDVPIQDSRLDEFQKFLSDWQTENNDEPFWNDFSGTDLEHVMVAAGFAENKTETQYLQAVDGPIPWYVVSAAK